MSRGVERMVGGGMTISVMSVRQVTAAMHGCGRGVAIGGCGRGVAIGGCGSSVTIRGRGIAEVVSVARICVAVGWVGISVIGIPVIIRIPVPIAVIGRG